jgi:hypothetical protein
MRDSIALNINRHTELMGLTPPHNSHAIWSVTESLLRHSLLLTIVERWISSKIKISLLTPSRYPSHAVSTHSTSSGTPMK